MTPNSDTRPRSRRATSALVALVAGCALAFPAASFADMVIGSTLSQPATTAVTHGTDTAFWQTTFADGSRPAVPVAGQIYQIKLKGFAARPAGAGLPLTQIHFQDLRPQGDGSLRIISTTQPFNLPVGGSPDHVSVFFPIHFFAQAGDYIAFNDEGGFDPTHGFPAGVPYQVFASVPGSTTQQFTRHNGTFNGDSVTPSPLGGVELLQQMVLIPNSTTGPPARVPRQVATVGRGGRTVLKISCPGANSCVGTFLVIVLGSQAASLRASGARLLVLARGGFHVASGSVGTVTVRISRRGRKLLKKHGGRLRAIFNVASGLGGTKNAANGPIVLRSGG